MLTLRLPIELEEMTKFNDDQASKISDLLNIKSNVDYNKFLDITKV